MKKLAAILLLAVYLFNIGGYSLLFRYFIHQSEQVFTRQLDENNYKESELIQISIPLHLPYIQNNSAFERMEGSIENNGIQYNYVKRKVYNDTLYIMCLPNNYKMQLVKGKSLYAGEANDFASSRKDKESSAKKINFSTAYSNLLPQYHFGICPIETGMPNSREAYPLQAAHINTPGHPPKVTC